MMGLLDERLRNELIKLGCTAALTAACSSADVAETQAPASVEQAQHGPNPGILARIVEAAPAGSYASCEANVRGLSLQPGNYRASVTLRLSDFFSPDGLNIFRTGLVSAAAPVHTDSTSGTFFKVELFESPPASGEYRIRAHLRGPQPFSFSPTEEALTCNVAILDPASIAVMTGAAQASLDPLVPSMPSVAEANSARIAGEHFRCKWRLHDPPSPLDITASTTTDLGSDVSVFGMASGDPTFGPLDMNNGGVLIAEWMPPPFPYQSPTLEIRFDRFPMPTSNAGACDFSATHFLTRVGTSRAGAFTGDPPCIDGIDNDGDGFVDYPNDPGCVDSFDNSEEDDCPIGEACPQCGNGIDDDNFGDVDFQADPDCTAASDNDEGPRTACSDGIDNDVDSWSDFPHDPGCLSLSDNAEQDTCPFGPDCPECFNEIDDDGDGFIDFPADPDCTWRVDDELP